MRSLYNNICALLKKVDFDGIWRGFRQCDFALYNSNGVWTADREMLVDARFVSNTAIDFEDAQLAIWHVEDDANADAERIAAGLVHEMFHAHQAMHGETRWPDEFALLAYPHDADNYRLKLAENHYLVKAFAENSAVDFAQFEVLRRARRRILGDAIQCELFCETTEGMAEYAGLMALNMIARGKFIEEVEEHLRVLKSPQMLMNTRLAAYSSGALLCFALKALGVDFYHNLTETKSLFELILREDDVVSEAMKAADAGK